MVQCWLLVCRLRGAWLVLLLLACQSWHLPGALRGRGVAAQQCLVVPSPPKPQDCHKKRTDLALLEEACLHLWTKKVDYLSHPLLVWCVLCLQTCIALMPAADT